MRIKFKAVRADTPEEVEEYRKQGLIFKIDHSFLDEYKKTKEKKEKEFCKRHKIAYERFKRYMFIFRRGGEKSLKGIFRKHRVKKPKSDMIFDFLSKL